MPLTCLVSQVKLTGLEVPEPGPQMGSMSCRFSMSSCSNTPDLNHLNKPCPPQLSLTSQEWWSRRWTVTPRGPRLKTTDPEHSMERDLWSLLTCRKKKILQFSLRRNVHVEPNMRRQGVLQVRGFRWGGRKRGALRWLTAPNWSSHVQQRLQVRQVCVRVCRGCEDMPVFNEKTPTPRCDEVTCCHTLGCH